MHRLYAKPSPLVTFCDVTMLVLLVVIPLLVIVRMSPFSPTPAVPPAQVWGEWIGHYLFFPSVAALVIAGLWIALRGWLLRRQDAIMRWLGAMRARYF